MDIKSPLLTIPKGESEGAIYSCWEVCHSIFRQPWSSLHNHLVALRANLHYYHLAWLDIQSGDAVSGVCAVEQLAVERSHLDCGVAAETGYGDLSVGSRNHWLSGSLGLFDAGGESLEFAESAPRVGSLVCIHRLARHIERHVSYRRSIKCARMRFPNIHCLTIYVFQRLATIVFITYCVPVDSNKSGVNVRNKCLNVRCYRMQLIICGIIYYRK